MRKFLNRVLYPIGYRIERLSRFRREMDKLLKDRTPFKFVQIGANDGVRFDNLYSIVTSRKCSGIVVEPLPDMYARLQANYADYPDIIPIRTAVHASEHSLPIYRVAPTAIRRYDAWATGIGSFDREHLIRHGIATEDILGELVQCIPLMTLLQQTGTLDADLLQVDAEGYDAAIVLMIDFEAFRPRIIKYEHKNMTPQEREQVLAKLTSNSYLTASEGTDTIAWQAA